jgi:hypothetical protein
VPSGKSKQIRRLVRQRGRAEVLPQVWRRQHNDNKFSDGARPTTLMHHRSLWTRRIMAPAREELDLPSDRARRVLPTRRVFGFALSDTFAFEG